MSVKTSFDSPTESPPIAKPSKSIAVISATLWARKSLKKLPWIIPKIFCFSLFANLSKYSFDCKAQRVVVSKALLASLWSVFGGVQWSKTIIISEPIIVCTFTTSSGVKKCLLPSM